ncbi:unnamed protein product [Urochloa humidicola]
MPANYVRHDGLLEQLATSRDYKDEKATNLLIEPSDNEVLTCVGSSSLFLEHVVETPVVAEGTDDMLEEISKHCVSDTSQVMNERKVFEQSTDSNMCELSRKHGFRPLNNGTMQAEEIPTGMYGGFSPGKIDQQMDLYWMTNGEISWAGKQVGDYIRTMKLMQRAYQPLSPAVYLYGATQMGKYRMVVDCIFGAYMIWVDYKGVAIFVRTLWDPGIWRYIVRELVLECSMLMIKLLSSR